MRRFFTVPGAPVGKQRPRATARNGHARMYTPVETVNYENLVKLSYQAAYGNADPIKEAVRLLAIAYVPVPESWSNTKKAKALGEIIHPTTKPDCSNILKSIEDGLNQIAYLDDKQIYDTHLVKKYSVLPRVEVSLYWDE